MVENKAMYWVKLQRGSGRTRIRQHLVDTSHGECSMETRKMEERHVGDGMTDKIYLDKVHKCLIVSFSDSFLDVLGSS